MSHIFLDINDAWQRLGPSRCNNPGDPAHPDSSYPYDGYYSGDFLDSNRIIGVSAIISDDDYSGGVGSVFADKAGPNEKPIAVDKGALLGLKFHLNSP